MGVISKSLVLVFLVATIAGSTFVIGQSPNETSPESLTSVTYGPGTRIIADEIRYDENQRTAYARGDVRIVSESSTITADEADVRPLRSTAESVDLDLELRGNVRLIVTPLDKGMR